MNQHDQNRRRLLFGALLVPFTPLVNAATLTPRAAEGPFYPTPNMRFNDIDNDLVKIDSADATSLGEVVRINGQVITESDQALNNAVVEIWQCDANGRYLHSGDRGPGKRDGGFQGIGRDITDSEGKFTFRTIRPVPYPGRTPHIHVKVWVENRERLTTQWYLPDHPLNKQDFLYQRIPVQQRNFVSLFFDNSAEPQAAIQLVV